MPGVYHLSVDKLLLEAETILGLEIRAVILFGLPEVKDEMGTAAYKSDGVVQHAVRELKRSFASTPLTATVVLSRMVVSIMTVQLNCWRKPLSLMQKQVLIS
jgi:porphobilinogen synthase